LLHPPRARNAAGRRRHEHRSSPSNARRDGDSLEWREIKLGGGAKRRIPNWANPHRHLDQGPALDDEALAY
jgi:hypothetical protein